MVTKLKLLTMLCLFLFVSPTFAIQEKPLHPKLPLPPQPTQHALNRPTPMPTPERKVPQHAQGNASKTMPAPDQRGPSTQ